MTKKKKFLVHEIKIFFFYNSVLVQVDFFFGGGKGSGIKVKKALMGWRSAWKMAMGSSPADAFTQSVALSPTAFTAKEEEEG